MSIRYIPFIASSALVALLTVATPHMAGAQTAPDNTKVNKRDRAAQAVTADQQKETASDREITQKIRQALMADKSLSTYAHNVKIVTRNGLVTLKGPVRSAEEKDAIVSSAKTIVKADQITNQLSVAAPKK